MKLNDRPCGVPFGSDASKLSRGGGPAPSSSVRAALIKPMPPMSMWSSPKLEQAMEFYRRFVLDFGA